MRRDEGVTSPGLDLTDRVMEAAAATIRQAAHSPVQDQPPASRSEIVNPLPSRAPAKGSNTPHQAASGASLPQMAAHAVGSPLRWGQASNTSAHALATSAAPDAQQVGLDLPAPNALPLAIDAYGFSTAALGVGAESGPEMAPDSLGAISLAIRDAAPAWLGHIETTSQNTPSQNQVLDFTTKQAVALSSLSDLSLSIPSAFYQNRSYGISAGGGGFGVSGGITAAGGIAGSLGLSPGSIIPNVPLVVNAETAGYVQDGNIFTVDPTLVATDDASYQLNLPTVEATAKYGLEISGGVTLSFPSVSIGYTLFGHFIGYTVGIPPLSENLVQAGQIETLPTNASVEFPGGTATIRELTGGTFTSTSPGYQRDTLSVLTGTGYTNPFLQASFDPIQALSQYVPELKILDGSEDFGVGSADWSLLSLPLSASLKVAETATITPGALTVTATETVGGTTTSLGTHNVVQGHSVTSNAWTLTAPAKGGGAIDLNLYYNLTLTVQAALSVEGSFGLYLNGPQVSAELVGQSFGAGPLFSLGLYTSKTGTFLTDTLPSTTVTLTEVQHDIVFYGTSAVVQVLSGLNYNGYTLKAGGEQFKLAANAIIAPTKNAPLSSIGIAGTLGAAGVYNYGTIFPVAPSTSSARYPGGMGIYLPGGGKILNAGDINAAIKNQPSLQGFKTTIQYGIDVGGALSTVTNTGTIGGVDVGLYVGNKNAASGTYSTSFIYNNAGGTIAAAFDGIRSKTGVLWVHNQGSISGASEFGVYDRSNLLVLYNSSSGTIGSSGTAAVADGGFGFVANQGHIGRSTASAALPKFGVELGSGEVNNTGIIYGSSTVVAFTTAGGNDYLLNSGKIIGVNGATAASMNGAINRLVLTPGESINGAVFASPTGTNSILLQSGNGTGRFNNFNSFKYANFHSITLASGAAWNLFTTTGFDFGGATISNLSKLDKLAFYHLGFTYGMHANISANGTNGVLSVYSASGSLTDTVQLTGLLQNAHAKVTGDNQTGYTYVRVWNGNFSNQITAANPGLTLNAGSYYGGALTIGSTGSASYNLSGFPQQAFGLDLQAVTATSTVTIGGSTSVTSAISPGTIVNEGNIAGNSQGILLQSGASVTNMAGTITSAHGVGVAEPGNYGAVTLQNTGLITGSTYGISLVSASTVINGSTGSISGANGIFVGAGGAVFNAGQIDATAGNAVELGAGDHLVNLAGGTISGSAAAVTATGTAAVTNAGLLTGGVGVMLSGAGDVNNSYQVASGATIFGTITGTGAYGIVAGGGSATITNGGGTLSGLTGLAEIDGISLASGGVVVNGAHGHIAAHGGYGLRTGSVGVLTLVNAGKIDSIDAGSGGTLGNTAGGTIGMLTGNTGAAALNVYNAGKIGGSALSLAAIRLTTAGTVSNAGIIQGASGVVFAGGGSLNNQAGGSIGGSGPSGFGVEITNSTLTNAGSIFGAAGAYPYAYGSPPPRPGVGLTQTGGSATNSGLIAGGSAGRTPSYGTNPGGASGASLTGGILVNSGRIIGGSGAYSPGQAGNGGAGLVLSGGLVENTGLIAGGAGGYAYFDVQYQQGGAPGNGGVGVYINGGTLINDGTIAGAAGGALLNTQYSGQAGVAVEFGGAAGTLVINPSAVFNGLVVANAAVNDALLLTGGVAATPGTLTGLGVEFLNFSTLGVEAASHWVLAGDNSFGGTVQLIGALKLGGGTLSGGGALNVYTRGRLEGTGVLTQRVHNIGTIALAGGTLTIEGSISGGGALALGSGQLVLAGGGSLSGNASGNGTLIISSNVTATSAAMFGNAQVTVNSGASLSGAGMITAHIADSGTIAAASGTLSIANTITGTGALAANNTATLLLSKAGKITQVISGTGTLALAAGTWQLTPSAVTVSHIALQAGANVTARGTLAGAVNNLGTIAATPGTLVLAGALSGGGSLVAAAGAKIILAGGGTAAAQFSGAGVFAITNAMSLSSGASLGGATVNLSANLKLLSGTSLINSAGATLRLFASTSTGLTVSGLAGDTLTNAGTLLSNGSGPASLATTLVNSGTLIENAGTLSISGALNNTGTVTAQGGCFPSPPRWAARERWLSVPPAPWRWGHGFRTWRRWTSSPRRACSI